MKGRESFIVNVPIMFRGHLQSNLPGGQDTLAIVTAMLQCTHGSHCLKDHLANWLCGSLQLMQIEFLSMEFCLVNKKNKIKINHMEPVGRVGGMFQHRDLLVC